MKEKERVFLLVLIMAAACLAVAGTTIAILYRTAFEEQRNVLETIAKNQARLLEEMARFDAARNRENAGGPEHGALNQVLNADMKFVNIGHTGEVTIGKREGDQIVFLFRRRYDETGTPMPISMTSNIAEPMRRAVSGLSGTIVGLDYRGVMVLAAHEPVEGLNWGVVAKVDLSEVRTPFIRAGAIAFTIAALFVLIGAFSFIRVTHPIMRRLREHAQSLTDLVASLRQSERDLQKVRDELEFRVEERTADLVLANSRLELEVQERTRAEERLRALWKIAALVDAKDEELYDNILQGTLRMTQSKYAFYGFLDPGESVMSIYSWSRDVSEDCRMAERPIQFHVAKAGLWAEAIRRKRVLVVNNYEGDNPGKCGTPEGHIPLTRILVMPVFGFGRIVSIVAAANKSSDYNDDDIKQLEAYAGGVQMIIDRRKMESSLRASEKECRLLSRQVIDAQEKERKRVAREIHDSIGQSLAAIKYRAEACISIGDGDEGRRTRELQSVIQMIRKTIEEVRKIQSDLHPAHLDLIGVLATISDFCAQYRETYPAIQVSTSFQISEPEVPDYLKTPLFRIFQEAMNNAAKHSRADRIEIRVHKSDNALELSIEDNGAGFSMDKEGSGTPKGFGLISMKERAELSGGRWDFQSEPDRGVTIRATWPL